jgi:ubiquinone/menaquinone biosynthesis C-methylase UbiE/DNA-binding transcriptional ArsR family regulator
MSFWEHEMSLNVDHMSELFKAIGEPTRLRILVLLGRGDLTVSDLTLVLNQSQPRVSRHLKLLTEAGVVTRYQEGSWAWFRLADQSVERSITDTALQHIDMNVHAMQRDIERLEGVRRDRQARAADYFARNASDWDALRSLHAPDDAVEVAMLGAIKGLRIDTMLDLGTGTGRLLELFAPHYQTAVGIDMSREMLAVARAKLENAKITKASIRQGDVSAPPVERGRFDLVTIHQVLHYLDEPQVVINEAARALRAGGTLLVVDFASHDLEYLRDKHAHQRLGFSDEQMSGWFRDIGLDFERVEMFSTANKSKGCAAGSGAALTVKLWVARDTRVLVANTDHNSNRVLETV